MARQTMYIVQAFVAAKGDPIKAEKPLQFKTGDEATRRARLMEGTKAGVVAYATSGDPDLGDYDEKPEILFKAGILPGQFDD